MTTTTSKRWLLGGLFVVSTALPAALAQTAPQAPAKTDDRTDKEEEPVILSPFVVDATKDKGYKVTNAISGTRLNTAIMNVPLNLEVITSDFIRDTGAVNLRESLRYSAGVVLESQSDAFYDADANPQTAGANDPRGATRSPGDSTTKLRGFVIDQVLRDGFRRQFSADSINIDRVEVLRGPSALLYGVGSLGGVINYVPKRPEKTPFNYFGATIGSQGLYRAEFDINRPLSDSGWKPALRVMGSFQERGDFTQYYKEQHWTVAPVFTFQPFKNTQVVLDNEFGYSKQTGNGFQNIRRNIGNQGAQPSRLAEWLTDSSGGIIKTRTFRWSGSDPYLKGPFRNNIIDITQKVGDDLYFKVGAAQSYAEFDSRQVNAGVAPSTFNTSNPDAYYDNQFVNLGDWKNLNIKDAVRAAADDPSGKYGGVYSVTDIFNARTPGAFRGDKLFGFVQEQLFTNIGPTPNGPKVNNQAMIWYTWKDYNRDETRNQVRLEATWTHDFGRWGKHTFLTGMQYMGMKSVEDEYGPAYSYTNQTTEQAVSVKDYQRNNYKNPGDFSPFRFGMQGDGLPDVPMHHLYNYLKKTWDLGYYGVYQGQFFNDRLTMIAGTRWDRDDARTVEHWIYEQGHPVVTQGPGSPGTFGKVPTAVSPQLGASVKLLPNLSLFGVYSTGAVPNPYAADGNGNILRPTKAKNAEVGLKFDLMNGKISGTVSAYRITRQGAPKFIWWAPNPYQSTLQGWKPDKPNAVLGSFATPDAMWAVIHSTQGMNTDQGLALAKRIWSSGWYPLLDELASVSDRANAFSGPQGSKFWQWDTGGYAYAAQIVTGNYDPKVTGTDSFQNLWYPLFNLSDPDVAKAFNAIQALPGWKGNYYVDPGNTYRFADGTPGFTNGPGASGANVPMDDVARGWDASVIITPNDWMQIMLNFAHVNRKVTTRTYHFVKLGYWPAGFWMQPDTNFGTYSPNRPASQAYTDINDASTYNVTVPDYNRPVDDTPENTASAWMHLNLDRVMPVKGFSFGFGGYWEDRRLWWAGFSGGGNISALPGTSDSSNPANLVELYTKQRLTVNAMIDYRMKFAAKYDWRIALNVDNLLDDQKVYGLVYAPGRSVRLTSSIRF